MALVEKVRLSLGTAIQLGLEAGFLDPCFTTAFLMTYRDGKCNANCAFCPQARESTSSSDRLSRISWPVYSFDEVLDSLDTIDTFRRYCIQSLNYPQAVEDVASILKELRVKTSLPVSVSIHPLDSTGITRLHDAGATSIGVAFDACTPELFDEVKGKKRGAPYRWETHLKALQDALEIFGQGNVTTHLVIGLGETEKEAADFILTMNKMGISVGLFALTGVRGTTLEKEKPPELSTYRRMQALRFLISHGYLTETEVVIDSEGALKVELDASLLGVLLSSGEAFRTSGCQGCNRPFYNERPSGPMYNYPRPLTPEEAADALALTGW
ncbi:MAG: radical SAM protein [Candidatus Thorarchaeota archaeon]|nr:MAG: radical SAM protein [Candidatus Thorarchaeota archaeon]